MTAKFRKVMPAVLAIGLALLMPRSIAAREWTSNDGKKLEAEFVSATAEAVLVRRAGDGRDVSLPLARLSEADRQWVGTQKPPVPPADTGRLAAGPYAELITGEWALSKFKNLPFALYASKDLKAGQTHPLVVMLHGKSSNDENGRQVASWMKSLTLPARYERHPCVLLAPLCYQPHGDTGGGWSDEPGRETVALVKDLLKSLPLDKARIYLTGYSMGGFGTCHLLTSEPRLFAAGILIAGGGGTGDAATLKRIPLWVFHAADDAVVKVDGARALAKALQRSKTFKYTEYLDGGHGIPDRVFADDAVHQWLFAQRGKR